ncbi:MAG: LytTR family transcriptional regulator [Lewinellaceae bacterium]|nr:LytTR family transcriptional regulator [Lewinellaceae bacterium]
MDFLKMGEILRCEVPQRFTRIVTTEGKGIISSYHIGVFRDLLENQGFFSPHKSHLVNLQYIRKLLREGTLVMRDGSTVPVVTAAAAGFPGAD